MLKKTANIGIALILFSVFSINSVLAQSSRDSLRSDFSVELLGKAAVYSFSFQYMAMPELGVEVGVSALGGSFTGGTVFFFPIGARIYPVPKNGSPFFTGGLVTVTADFEQGSIKSASYGYAGLGFEFRAGSGFLFRGTAYGLILGGDVDSESGDEVSKFIIWPGLTVGYAF